MGVAMAKRKAKKHAECSLEVGDHFYEMNTGPGYKRMWYKVHVRGFVDEQMIVRWWSKSEKYWRYQIYNIQTANYFVKRDVWKLKKPKKPRASKCFD